jgi:LysM repeat protein
VPGRRNWVARGIIPSLQYNDSVRHLVLGVAMLAAACTSAAPEASAATPVLRPYATITPSATSDQVAGRIISPETPPPSPTPSRYTIGAGDTLSQIAERNNLTLDALLAANPGVNPAALRVGEVLLLPAAIAGDSALATATPAPLPISQIACRPTASGAVWCFALVHNDTPHTFENVTGQIMVVDSAGTELASKSTVLPLDILPPGAALPLAVVFTEPLPVDAKPLVRILTAIQLLPDDPRYVPAVIQDSLAQVSWAGLSAQVSGHIYLPESSPDAASVWLAAAAYDESGNLIGWRRSVLASGLSAGSTTPFEFMVSSLAGRIDRVEVLVQARP